MYQQFQRVNRAAAPIAREVISLMLWVTRRVLRVLLRRPMLDVLLLLLLYCIANMIGRFTQPQPGLYGPPTLIERR
jgi:hypothetical protein